MATRDKWLVGLLIAYCLCLVLFGLEAGVGHDGLLCELGYDSDGAAELTTGCG